MKGWAISLLIWIVAMTGYLGRQIDGDARSNDAASCFYQPGWKRGGT